MSLLSDDTERFWTADVSTGIHYQINSESALTWHQARKSCQQQNAELLSITETQEQAYIGGKKIENKTLKYAVMKLLPCHLSQWRKRTMCQQPPKGGWSELPFHCLGLFYEALLTNLFGSEMSPRQQKGAPAAPALCPRGRVSSAHLCARMLIPDQSYRLVL